MIDAYIDLIPDYYGIKNFWFINFFILKSYKSIE